MNREEKVEAIISICEKIKCQDCPYVLKPCNLNRYWTDAEIDDFYGAMMEVQDDKRKTDG